ncbi:MAG: hypothetical protein KA419_08045 [Acidobacteria bacterium]|nr:hypothetical protein [Acidobacteriota bacterium]
MSFYLKTGSTQKERREFLLIKPIFFSPSGMLGVQMDETGHSHVKEHERSLPTSARRAAMRMVSEKLDKGYEEKPKQGKSGT